jgi:hypothetical protein
MLSACMILFLAMDLTAIKSEPNLERRSDLAIDFASASFDDARDAYNAGDTAKWRDAIRDVGASVELSYQALEETGKAARNNKHFKNAELKTRELLRRLDGMRDMISLEDRDAIEAVRGKVSEVHDQLLQRIMSRKK